MDKLYALAVTADLNVYKIGLQFLSLNHNVTIEDWFRAWVIDLLKNKANVKCNHTRHISKPARFRLHAEI